VEFLEEHYFRLMSSMRMTRMKIPVDFTLEAYDTEIKKTAEANGIRKRAEVRVNFYRVGAGQVFPESNRSEFIIHVHEVNEGGLDDLEIELFKDFHVSSGLLSTIKTNNRMVNVLSAIFAHENGFQNSVLINEKKELVSASDANLFLVRDNRVLTPSLDCGCINGILRKKVIESVQGIPGLELEETSISPFELLKVDEVFLTNSVWWIRSVSRYRKRSFGSEVAGRIKRQLTLAHSQ
jgi:branched-chain amino acid aminotransferase